MKTIITFVLLSILVIVGTIISIQGDNPTPNSNSNETLSNITTAEGKQIINIKAKGGYSPKITEGKAETPTIIRLATQGTFDCSASLTIPSLNIRKNLSPTGNTDIEIPPQKAGTKLLGICSMGMYNFAINFN